MNCGMNDDDDQDLFTAGPTVTAPTCSSGQPCNKSTCERKAGVNGSPKIRSSLNCIAAEGSCDKNSSCLKCKTARAVVLVRQREPLCQTCLEAGVSGKVRALKANKLLIPHDFIAVAFSGGFCSQTLLCNVLAMRKTAATARKERGKIEFDLVVVHINEATAHGLSSEAAVAHGQAVQAAAQRCSAGGPLTAIHVVPLSDVFLFGGEADPACPCDGGNNSSSRASVSSASEEVTDLGQQLSPDVNSAATRTEAAAATQAREARLQALLQSVPDPTGREDLLRHLRNRLLAAVAARLGVSKVMRGDTATTLAARIISDTSKGRGYALPGEIQLLDARGVLRGEPAMFQPMREVTKKEAVFFCRLRGLHPVQLPYGLASSRRSINMLASSFVEGLQANLPSTLFTILRTAAALKPFPFNSAEALSPPLAGTTTVPEDMPRAVDAGTSGNGGGDITAPTSSCCVICRGPLMPREQEAIAAAGAATALRSLRVQSGNRHGGREAMQGVERPSSSSGSEQTGTGNSSLSAVANEMTGEKQEGSVTATAASDGDGLEGGDLSAPFCTSCRGQILFTPEQSAGAGAATNASRYVRSSGEGGTAGFIVESKALSLLPTCFRP